MSTKKSFGGLRFLMGFSSQRFRSCLKQQPHKSSSLATGDKRTDSFAAHTTLRQTITKKTIHINKQQTKITTTYLQQNAMTCSSKQQPTIVLSPESHPVVYCPDLEVKHQNHMQEKRQHIFTSQPSFSCARFTNLLSAQAIGLTTSKS